VGTVGREKWALRCIQNRYISMARNDRIRPESQDPTSNIDECH
jgi:hypothetical protein